MQYLLLIYSNESDWTDTEREACYAESTQLCHQLQGAGQYLAATPLHPVTMATSVRVREGKRLITDGPFAETHEHLGGFFLIDVNDLDEAIEVAGRIPGARKGTVEVRPVLQLPDMPQTETVAKESLSR